LVNTLCLLGVTDSVIEAPQAGVDYALINIWTQLCCRVRMAKAMTPLFNQLQHGVHPACKRHKLIATMCCLLLGTCSIAAAQAWAADPNAAVSVSSFPGFMAAAQQAGGAQVTQLELTANISMQGVGLVSPPVLANTSKLIVMPASHLVGTPTIMDMRMRVAVMDLRFHTVLQLNGVIPINSCTEALRYSPR
jgi:hypothetical protein